MGCIDVTDWLNLNDPCHVRALKRYWETGRWPKGFIPKNVVFDENWVSIVERARPDVISEFKPFYLDQRAYHKPVRVNTRKSRRNDWDEVDYYD